MVLFKKFKIDKLEFALSSVTPLYLTGRFSGLVVSAGASAVEIMPVYESKFESTLGYPMFRCFKYLNTGTRAMLKVIKDEIMLQNPEVKQEVFAKMTDEYLNDLLCQHSNMNVVKSKSEDVVNFIFKKSRLKLKPANLTYTNLFGNS